MSTATPKHTDGLDTIWALPNGMSLWESPAVDRIEPERAKRLAATAEAPAAACLTIDPAWNACTRTS